jgi:hypothetical protein
MPETRARFVTLADSTTTHLRAMHTPCGGVTFQRFSLGGSAQVALTADQLAVFLRSLPLDVVREACLELEARAIVNATVLGEVERLEREDNPFFDLDTEPAPLSPFYMALGETGLCHYCHRTERGHVPDHTGTGRLRCVPQPPEFRVHYEGSDGPLTAEEQTELHRLNGRTNGHRPA